MSDQPVFPDTYYLVIREGRLDGVIEFGDAPAIFADGDEAEQAAAASADKHGGLVWVYRCQPASRLGSRE